MRISDWSSDVCSSDLIDYDRLLALIDGLPERRRRIVRMRKIEGLSQREIAERLDVSESIVETEVFRGVPAVQRAWREGEAKGDARLAGPRDGRSCFGSSNTQSPARPDPTSPRGNTETGH